jgi:hypothetical protein
MRFGDTYRLATTNLRKNKRRSITVIMTMAVIFGLIIGVSFFTRGTWNLLLKSSFGQSGQTYLSLGYTVRGGKGEENVNSLIDTIPSLDAFVKQYGGRVVGIMETYDQIGNDQIRVIDRGVAEILAIGSVQEVPDGKIGVLTVQNWGGMEESSQFVKVGELCKPDRNDMIVQDLAPSNMFVGSIWSFGTPEYYLVDSVMAKEYAENELKKSFEKYEDYIESLPESDITEQDQEDLFYKKSPSIEVVAEFDDYQQALKLVDSAENATDFKTVPKAVNYNGVSYGLSVEDLFGHYTTGIVRKMNYSTDIVLAPIILILTAVALIVVLSTFAHLVESDIATILLYRVRGASLGQVYFIYLVYLLELCLLAVGLSIMIGLILTLGMSTMNALAGFSEAVQGFFGLAKAPFGLLVGIDTVFWRSIGLMLLTAPIILLMTSWRFSSKHIAKKLKEEM